MKGNNGTGNNVERDEWETPQWLFDILDKQYVFYMDWCASEKNKKCESWTDNMVNTAVLPKTICWMNPPFSKALEMFKEFFKRTPKGVAIYRCDNFETKIWQDIIFPNATWIFIPNKRIAYEGMNGIGSRFPSALIGLNVGLPKRLKGTILKSVK